MTAKPDSWHILTFLVGSASFVLRPTLSARLEEIEPGCTNNGLTCFDVSPEQVFDPNVLVEEKTDAMTVRVSPAATSRILVLPHLFREEWECEGAGVKLPTSSWHGLISVAVPENVDRLQLSYRPRVQWALRALTYLTLSTLSVWLLFKWFASTGWRNNR